MRKGGLVLGEYNSAMLIVIPGALPDASVAGELARHLPGRAPVLHTWLSTAEAHCEAFDLHQQGCTPYEAWQLEHAGYRGEAGLPWGAGLGPLLAGDSVDDIEPVWLGELVHLALGTDRASLLSPDEMDVRPEESQALLDAAAPAFEGSGFTAAVLAPQRWRLTLPEGLRPWTASPQAVAGHPLNAWWQQDPATRPWRRLLNEIQMAWHEHPVNEARSARGVAPANGLWLYGGATSWPAPARVEPAEVFDALDAPQRAGDWAAWLDALADLDARRLAPLAQGKYRLPAPGTEILLLGADRRARLAFKPRTGWLRWLPPVKYNWNAWWSPPV
jgi:hypothetical protein